MRRIIWIALISAACGTSTTDTKADAGPVFTRSIRDVNGTVKLHPGEVAWRAGPGAPSAAPPSFEGMTINLESALDALGGRPPLKTALVGANGAFAFTAADLTNVQIGLVASVKDDAGALAFSGYGLGKPPFETDLPGVSVYVVTRAFLDQLATAKGSTTGAEMETNGLVLGQIVDRSGAPIAGAKLARAFEPPAAVTENVEYLSGELTGVGGDVTSANGLFLFNPAAGTTKEYTGIKPGVVFDVHLSGIRSGAVLSLFIREKQ